MKLPNRNFILSCGIAVASLALAHPAAAASFTIVNGRTVTTTQTLDTPGDVGAVEQGGVIVAPGDAMSGGASFNLGAEAGYDTSDAFTHERSHGSRLGVLRPAAQPIHRESKDVTCGSTAGLLGARFVSSFAG